VLEKLADRLVIGEEEEVRLGSSIVEVVDMAIPYGGGL
jgi:hypothetical protein